MSVRFHVDNSELERLEADISVAGIRAGLGVTKVLRTKVGPKLALEMRQDARDARRSRPSSISLLPKGVEFELIAPNVVEAGIRPRNRRQGSLAHILAYGSVNNAPVFFHERSLRRTVPFAVNWLADMAEESVLGDD